ncbi:MAG: S8 family serine peptidase, partial [Dysgonamonadaceae bacterium]|nr:S8 family serine peptidase [Dysgonamonadaceae bacterium]
MNRIVSLFLFFFFCATTTAYAEEMAMYRLQLIDKGDAPYRTDQPEAFLSPKSIERRIKQGFPVDETDLPVDPAYFDAIAGTGASVKASSKWLKTIVALVPGPDVLMKIQELPFVGGVTKVWSGESEGMEYPDKKNRNDEAQSADNVASDYGGALKQIEINNALLLHQAGYRGSGKTIAVLDAGFKNVDRLPDFFDPDKIIEAKNFTHEEGSPYRIEQSHGTAVLSCLLADSPGVMIGTAPGSQFYLFKTEVNGEEYPVEEDYWVAALEYADSLGVDIVTTSLGYFWFDDPTMNHTWDELDGQTVPASRAAAMAASKGMVLFHSAGNEGAREWQKVIIPADAEHILTVGAVESDSLRASFSAWGSIVNGRLKPDVMAMGRDVCLISSSGIVYYSNGTSFSAPVLAGMGACLWEALPGLTSFELIALIKRFSDRSAQPDEYFGYGIPNIYEAYLFQKGASALLPSLNGDEADKIYWDAVLDRLCLKTDAFVRATVFSVDGSVVLDQAAV